MSVEMAETAHLNSSVSVDDTTSLGVVYMVSSILVVVSNTVVFSVVIKSPSLHLPTLWHIAFMALCDFCFGLHILVFAVPSAFMSRFSYDPAFIAPSAYLFTFLGVQNILNILVATLDRYISMCWPLQYPRLVTSKRFILVKTTSVCFNVLFMVMLTLQESRSFYKPRVALCMFTLYSPIGAAMSIGLIVLTGMGIVGLFIRILIEMRRSRTRVHPLTTGERFNSFTFTIALSVGAFCLSFTPLFVSNIWNITYGYVASPKILVQLASQCVVCNSFWNVIIYGVVYKPFRDEFLRIFCRSYYRKQRQLEANIPSVVGQL